MGRYPEDVTMKRNTIGIGAIVALLFLTSSPAGGQNREHQQMAAELRILQEQNQQLLNALTQALTQLNETVKTINTRLDGSDTALKKALADQKVIIDNVGTEMRILRERTQDTNTRIGTLAEEVESLRTALPALTSAAASAALPAEAAGGGAAPPPAATAPSRSGVSPTRLFQTAYSDYTSGDYALAISGFQAYLMEFPRNAQADDAHLYIGESQLKLKKYPEAITAFTTVVQNYPTEDKVPEAYFRLGEAQRALGQTELARTAWQTVVNKYGDSPSAFLAKQRLDGLPPAPRQ
jgi:tol-pal system protein YbgF